MWKFKKLDLAVLVIWIFAIFLRLYRLNDFVTFLGDQGRDAIIMRRIVTLEHFPAIGAPSSIGQIYLGPFYYYLIAPFLFLFKFNPIGMAVGVAILSIIGIIAAYYVIKKEVNTQTAIIFLILATFSAVHIDLSRFSWNPNLLPLFSFFTLYFFYKFISTAKFNFVYCILFGAFFSFSFQLHHLSGLIVIPLAIVVIERLLKHKMSLRHIYGVSFSIVSFTFFSAPLIIFDLRHDFLNTRNLIKLFTGNKISGSSSPLTQLLETVNSFFINTFKLDTPQYISLVLFILSIALVIYLYRKKDIPLLIFINSLQFFFFVIGFSFLNSPRHPHYYGSVYFSFFLLLAFICSKLWGKNLYSRSLVTLLIGLYIFLNIRSYNFIFSPGSFQINKAEEIAKSISTRITSPSYQLASLPFTETDGHIRYFLEVMGKRPLPEDSTVEPQELFVLCYEEDCSVLGNAQWQIANFKHATISNTWNVKGIKVYKLIHEK